MARGKDNRRDSPFGRDHRAQGHDHSSGSNYEPINPSREWPSHNTDSPASQHPRASQPGRPKADSFSAKKPGKHTPAGSSSSSINIGGDRTRGAREGQRPSGVDDNEKQTNTDARTAVLQDGYRNGLPVYPSYDEERAGNDQRRVQANA